MAVIAFIDSSSALEALIQYSTWAAQKLQQSLVLVSLDEREQADLGMRFDDYQIMNQQDDFVRELRSSEILADRNDGHVNRALASAADIARSQGIHKVRMLEVKASLPDYIRERTDSDDLLVMERPGPGNAGDSVSVALHAQHRTMLLVPESFTPPALWMMAHDGRAGAGEAVRYLCKFPLLNEVTGLAVIAGNDPAGKTHFRDAVGHLRSSGHTVRAHELRGNPDDILPAVIAVSEPGMLVMGAFGHSRLRSIIEGSTTNRLLEGFDGPILISRA